MITGREPGVIGVRAMYLGDRSTVSFEVQRAS